MRVFLSYSWACGKLADIVEKFLNDEKTFQIRRDKVDLKKMDSIKQFMLSIRDCDYSIFIINDDYLKSPNCLYEISTFFKEKDFKSKAIPMIYKNTNIFNFAGRNNFVQHWKKELSSMKSNLNISYQNLDELLVEISDINSIIFDESEKEEVVAETLLKILYDKLFDREIRPTRVGQNNNIILPDDPILCIDFGTSYTLSTIQDNNSKVHFIPDINGKISIPSVIEFFDTNTYIVGSLVSHHSANTVSYVVRNIKRLILTKQYYSYGANAISLIALIGTLLKSVYRNSQEYLGKSVSKVLLSVPTDFGTSEMKIIKKGAEIAGFKVSRMIQEASATSLLISNREETKSEFINIDLGGGTLDISLAEVEDGVCQILYSLGDKKLGSIDYDHAICEFIVNEIQEKYNLSFLVTSDVSLYSQIEFESEKIKIKLNTQERVSVSLESVNNISGNIIYYEVEITRGIFAKITQNLNLRIKNTLLELKKLINRNLINLKGKNIYLTGQGTKLFTVKEIIKEIFPDCTIHDKYQENAVSLGLSTQSGIMCGTVKDTILLDNFHIYFDVLCSRYNSEVKTIYFSNTNNLFVNLLSPMEDSPGLMTRTIPFKKYFKVKFDNLNEEYEIRFYDYSPSDNKRYPFSSLFFFPEPDIDYYIKIDVDAGGNIQTSVLNEYEMEKMEIIEEVNLKALLKNYNYVIENK